MNEEINPELKDFLQKMPKTELHVHIEGTLEVEFAWQLLLKYQYVIPGTKSFHIKKLDNSVVSIDSLENLQQLYQFQSLDDFLCLYNQLGSILQQKEDFTILVHNYMQKALENNIKHIEVFFDPQTHTSKGLSFQDVVDGLNEGFDIGRKQGITIYMIACILRDHTIGKKEEEGNILQKNPEEVASDPTQFSDPTAWKTLKQIVEYNQNVTNRNFPDYYKIIGMGLDNTELNYPPNIFKDLYEYAQTKGELLCVAHYGEVGPASYIQEAIEDLNIVRIDHGVQCINDPQLLSFLATPIINENFIRAYQFPQKMPLTVCPMSNYMLKVYKKPEDHNVGELLDFGIMVTINSDDPAYFGGYVSDNYEFLIKNSKPERPITLTDIKKLTENGFQSTFLPFQAKQKHLQDINEYFLMNPGFLYTSLAIAQSQQQQYLDEQAMQEEIQQQQQLEQEQQLQQSINHEDQLINQPQHEIGVEQEEEAKINEEQQQQQHNGTQMQYLKNEYNQLEQQSQSQNYQQKSLLSSDNEINKNNFNNLNQKYEKQQDDFKNQQYMEYIKIIKEKAVLRQQESDIQQMRENNVHFKYYSPLKYQNEKKN